MIRVLSPLEIKKIILSQIEWEEREIEREGETGEGEKMVLIKNNDSYNIVECNCVFEIFGRRDN